MTQVEFKTHNRNQEEQQIAQRETNRQAVETFVSVKSWEAWKGENDKFIRRLEIAVDKMLCVRSRL